MSMPQPWHARFSGVVCTPDPHGQDGEHCTPVGGWSFVSQSTYTYDSANNRTDLGAVLTPGNRATTFNGYTITYDNARNVTHKSKTGFDQYYYWNSIGQLDSVVTNGNTVHFGYDGQGRRVRKATATQTLRYIYSGSQLIAQMQEYLRQQQMADIYNELVSGDPNALSDFLGPYSFAIVNFPGRCPKNADFNGEIVSTEFFADAVHVHVFWVIPPVPAPAPGLGWYKGRIYSLNSLNLPNGRVGMNVSGIVPCGPGLQVGEFNEDNVIIQGSD